MRTPVVIASLAVWPLLGLMSGSTVAPLSVVLNFEQTRFSSVALRAMQAEAETILRDSGLQLSWTLARDLSQRSDLGDLIVFKLKGRCEMDAFPVIPDELGVSLAMTHASDGEILSFGEVDCDRVQRLIKRTMPASGYAKGDLLLGRALGRVVAHEMYHILSRSRTHAGAGVTRECLSARDLTGERLSFSDESLQAIRVQIGLVKTTKGSARQTAPGEALPPVTLP